MEIAPPRQRRSHQQRLDDAHTKANRTAKRLARHLVEVEKWEVASTLRDRKRDTRRKIIAGALALEEKDRGFRGKLLALIDEYVIADRDRELFGLEPLPAGVWPLYPRKTRKRVSSSMLPAWRRCSRSSKGGSSPCSRYALRVALVPGHARL